MSYAGLEKLHPMNFEMTRLQARRYHETPTKEPQIPTALEDWDEQFEREVGYHPKHAPVSRVPHPMDACSYPGPWCGDCSCSQRLLKEQRGAVRDDA